MVAVIITALVICAAMVAVRNRMAVSVLGWIFFAVQAAAALWFASGNGIDTVQAVFFTYDHLGALFFVLMALVSPVVFAHSAVYLRGGALREFRIYNISLVLLCASISGVYFANNLAVTWIFLEATTLATAGLVYHHRNQQSLEATWKYVFVCSTGIAIAYLGILLLSTIAVNGELSYENLARMAAGGNPLYMKIAVLFIFAGYSCKLEIFPLYPIGVDANTAAPTPASALISTALVNGGFVAMLRVYRVMAHSEIFPWVRSVLIVAGVLSLLVGALFLRRTNNYKRLLAYSTVENMGIAVIGLGIGGVGMFAAILHLVGHTFIKSGLFLQIARIGKAFGTYRINRSGDYMNISRTGSVMIIISMVLLTGFPPSALFVSEVMTMGGALAEGKWWLVAVMVALICVVIYTICNHAFRLCYRQIGKPGRTLPGNGAWLWSAFALVVPAVVLGIWQPGWFIDAINAIVML